VTGESGGTAQLVEAHSRAACANAVAKLRREPVGHEHAKRLARTRDVPEAGVELIDTEQTRVRLE
jgi:hypothetical protein